MRFVVLLGLLGPLALAACEVDVGPTSHPAGVDAPGGGGGSDEVDAGTRPPADAAGITCKNNVGTIGGNGHHNAGMDCLDGCHNHGFAFGGTLYMPGTNTPMVGATIVATDATGHTANAFSATNGNFAAAVTLEFPITVVVSSCPDLVQMVATIPKGSGGCNKSGCHAASGGQGRVHLP